MRRILRAFVCSVFIASAQPVLCQTPLELMTRADKAQVDVSFKGTKFATFQYGNKQVRSTAKVYHKAPDKTRIQFSSPNELKDVVMIENGDKAWEYCPHAGAWKSVEAIPTFQQERIDKDLLKTHTLSCAGIEKIAGRAAHILCVRPKSKTLPTRRLWLDKEYSIVLASRVTSRKGVVVSSSRFSSIVFSPRELGWTAFQPAGKILYAPDYCPSCGRHATPKYIPKGYKRISTGKVLVNRHETCTFHYSDGTHSFTIFQRKCDKTCDAKFLRDKAKNALVWSSGNCVFALVGDLPRAQLKRIADSTRL
jgi:negative regulator of sigma E activity